MNYFSALIVISAAAGVLCLLAPEDGSPASRFLCVFASVCVLSVAISPLWTARERLNALFESFEDFVESSANGVAADAVPSAASRQFARALESAVCERYGISDDRVRAAVTVDDSSGVPRLVSARVSVVGTDGVPDPKEIAAYLTELTGVPCSAVILAPKEQSREERRNDERTNQRLFCLAGQT